MRIKHHTDPDGKVHYQLNSDDIASLAIKIVDSLSTRGLIGLDPKIHDLVMESILDVISDDVDHDYWNYN